MEPKLPNVCDPRECHSASAHLIQKPLQWNASQKRRQKLIYQVPNQVYVLKSPACLPVLQRTASWRQVWDLRSNHKSIRKHDFILNLQGAIHNWPVIHEGLTILQEASTPGRRARKRHGCHLLTVLLGLEMQASLRAERFWEQTAAAFSVQSVEDWFSHPLLVSSLQLQLAVQNESVTAFMATLKAAYGQHHCGF